MVYQCVSNSIIVNLIVDQWCIGGTEWYVNGSNGDSIKTQW